jgi:aspartate/methionine/tyrosine aminotransferase
MKKNPKYRFNRISSVRYEQFEKLPQEVANDPETIMLWGDRYWQPIQKEIINDAVEIMRSYKIDSTSAVEARKKWIAEDYRYAIAEKLEKEDNIKIENPLKEIGTCHGAADGFACICGIFLEPGDEVLVFDPQFTFAWGLPDLHGAKTISVPLKEEKDWDLTESEIPELLEPLITKKTKMMISTIPGNPTGTVFSYKTTKAIGDILSDHEIIYLEDSVYERRLYDGKKFISMGSISVMKDYAVCIKGFSKIYNVQDFRVGYIVANEEIINKVWRWHMLGGIDPSNIFMKTMARALRRDMAGSLPPGWHEKHRQEWDTMRKWSYKKLAQIPGVTLRMPHAGTYHFINISKLGTSDDVFTYLRDKHRILLTPGNWYGPGGEGYMRLCYAANEPKTTKKGVNKVVDALSKLAKNKGVH